jgi:hypothetical protein
MTEGQIVLHTHNTLAVPCHRGGTVSTRPVKFPSQHLRLTKTVCFSDIHALSPASFCLQVPASANRTRTHPFSFTDMSIFRCAITTSLPIPVSGYHNHQFPINQRRSLSASQHLTHNIKQRTKMISFSVSLSKFK